MKQKLSKILATTLIFATLFTQVSAFASSTTLYTDAVLNKPFRIEMPLNKNFTGIVKYNNLEGGFYTLDQYVLSGNLDFSKFVEKKVEVTGILETNGMGINMWGVGTIQVKEIKVVTVAKTKTFKGIVKYNNLEGGFYTIGKYVLTGDFNFRKFVGKKVEITGVLDTDSMGISMTGKELIQVKSIKKIANR